MSNTDKYLTMAKYTGGNDGNDANKMMEEERRSKAYSKIIGAQTAQTLVSIEVMVQNKNRFSVQLYKNAFRV